MNTDRFNFRVAIRQEDGTYKRREIGTLWFMSDKVIVEYSYIADANNGKIGRVVIDGKKAILEQCTGLKDRSGNLIYEGDLVEKISSGSCYRSSYTKDDYISEYKDRKKRGVIIEEQINEKFNEVRYYFRTGETDVATMENFPCYWLKNESFGWEGEELQSPEDWLIVGNTNYEDMQP